MALSVNAATNESDNWDHYLAGPAKQYLLARPSVVPRVVLPISSSAQRSVILGAGLRCDVVHTVVSSNLEGI